MAGLDQDETADSSPQSIQYEELLEVLTRAVAKLKIDWPEKKQKDHPRSKLDKRFLHFLHAGAFFCSLISMPRLRDHGKRHIRLAYSAPMSLIIPAFWG